MQLIKIRTTKKLYIYTPCRACSVWKIIYAHLMFLERSALNQGLRMKLLRTNGKLEVFVILWTKKKKSTQYEKGKTLIYWPNPESTLVNMHETSIKCSLSGTHSRQHHVTSTRMLFIPTERVLPQLIKTLIFYTEKNH